MNFTHTSPLVTARRYAERELRTTGKKQATAEEVRWLHAHPLMWLRALAAIREDVQTHIAKSRADLEQLKPKTNPGAPSAEYMQARAEFAQSHQGRMHFMQLVEGRIGEVKAIIGPDSLAARTTTGEVVASWIRLAELINVGDFRAARDLANFWAERWAREMRSPVA